MKETLIFVRQDGDVKIYQTTPQPKELTPVKKMTEEEIKEEIKRRQTTSILFYERYKRDENDNYNRLAELRSELKSRQNNYNKIYSYFMLKNGGNK